MEGMKIRKNGESGQALFIAIIFLVALTILGFGLIMMASMDIHSSRNLRLAQMALNAAEEGALVGMAYASDPSTGFLALAPGDHLDLDSHEDGGKSLNEPAHYQVVLIKAGLAPVPEGEMVGTTGSGFKVAYVMVRVQSTGMVMDKKGTFSFSNLPPIRRTVDVLARIRVAG